MAFGKVALFSLVCLALVNSCFSATCELTVVTPSATAADIKGVGELLGTFLIDGDTDPIDNIQQPVFGAAHAGAFIVVYDVGADTTKINVQLLVGPTFGDLVDIGAQTNPITPAITFTCPGTGGNEFALTGFQITIEDKNNQAPTFLEVPNVIHYDVSLFNDAAKPILGTFYVDDADSTVANTVVTVAKVAGAAEVIVATTVPSSSTDSRTTFTVTLDAPIQPGQVNVTLEATNVGLGADTATPITLKAQKTIQLYFTAPSSAMQQAGAFVMVALLSVISAFAGKY